MARRQDYSHTQGDWGLEFSIDTNPKDVAKYDDWSRGLSTTGPYDIANKAALAALVTFPEGVRASKRVTITGGYEDGTWRVVKLGPDVEKLRRKILDRAHEVTGGSYDNAPFTAFVSAIVGRKVANESWYSTLEHLTDDEVTQVHEVVSKIYGKV